MDLDEIKKRRVEISREDLGNSEDNLNFLIPVGFSVLVVVLIIGAFAVFKKNGGQDSMSLNLDPKDATSSAQVAGEKTQAPPLSGPAVPSVKPQAQNPNVPSPSPAANVPNPMVSAPSPSPSSPSIPTPSPTPSPSPSPTPSPSPSSSPSVSPTQGP